MGHHYGSTYSNLDSFQENHLQHIFLYPKLNLFDKIGQVSSCGALDTGKWKGRKLLKTKISLNYST